MQRIIFFLFRRLAGVVIPELIRGLIKEFLPGYHLHRDPVKKKGGETCEK